MRVWRGGSRRRPVLDSPIGLGRRILWAGSSRGSTESSSYVPSPFSHPHLMLMLYFVEINGVSDSAHSLMLICIVRLCPCTVHVVPKIPSRPTIVGWVLAFEPRTAHAFQETGSAVSQPLYIWPISPRCHLVTVDAHGRPVCRRTS